MADLLERFKRDSETLLAAIKRADALYREIMSNRGFPHARLARTGEANWLRIAHDREFGEFVWLHAWNGQTWGEQVPVDCIRDKTYRKAVSELAEKHAADAVARQQRDATEKEKRERRYLAELIEKYGVPDDPAAASPQMPGRAGT